MNPKWQVNYYFSPSDNNPVKEFLDFYPSVKVKVFRIISHIQEFGLVSVIPHIKKLTGTSLWEIRILGQDSSRILFATLPGQKIILLHAFVKKSEKTPLREIKTGLSRLAEYQGLT